MMSRIASHKWGLLCSALWLLVVWSAYVMPYDLLRPYMTLWAGASATCAVVFVVGYLLLSRPSKNAAGKRQWESMWFWLVVLVGMLLIQSLRTFVFLLLIPAPPAPTGQQIQSYQWAVITFATCFFVIFWLTVVWIRLQVETRRALRRDGT